MEPFLQKQEKYKNIKTKEPEATELWGIWTGFCDLHFKNTKKPAILRGTCTSPCFLFHFLFFSVNKPYRQNHKSVLQSSLTINKHQTRLFIFFNIHAQPWAAKTLFRSAVHFTVGVSWLQYFYWYWSNYK